MKRFGVSVLLALVAACSSATDSEPSDSSVRLGVIDAGFDGDPVVTRPASVSVGESFQVTIRTYGPNTGWSEDRTEVETGPRSATIRVFDREVSEAAFAVLVELEHTAVLRFDEPGTATLRIVGRSFVQDSLVVQRLVTVTNE